MKDNSIERHFAGHDSIVVRDVWQRLISITKSSLSETWLSSTGVIRKYTQQQRLIQTESIELLSSLLYSDGGYTQHAIKMAAIAANFPGVGEREKKLTKQDAEDALEMFEDLPEGAQAQAAADHLGLDNPADMWELFVRQRKEG